VCRDNRLRRKQKKTSRSFGIAAKTPDPLRLVVSSRVGTAAIAIKLASAFFSLLIV